MADSRTVEMRKSVEEAWLAAIENSGARGKFKKALRVYADKDVGDVLESLDGAPKVLWKEWRDFLPRWCEGEVTRIHAELTALDDFIRKAAWEVAREHSRGESSRRLRVLEDSIVALVRERGGQLIAFKPYALAKELSTTKRSLKASRVDRAVRALCKKGAAKLIPVGKGHPHRLVLQ